MTWPPPHPLLLGHRGAPAELPENTLAGFRRAVELGADGVELDVQLSADGVPVVIHDCTLQRTTAGHGRVDQLPWARLREWVPSLAEAAAWGAGSGAWLNVEIKAAGAEATVLAALERAGAMDRSILSSFLPATVREARALEPRLPCCLLTERWDAGAQLAAAETGATGVCLEDRGASDSAVAELRAAGLPVVVWTADDPARIRALLRGGVAGIITNHPARAAQIRRELRQ